MNEWTCSNPWKSTHPSVMQALYVHEIKHLQPSHTCVKYLKLIYYYCSIQVGKRRERKLCNNNYTFEASQNIYDKICTMGTIHCWTVERALCLLHVFSLLSWEDAFKKFLYSSVVLFPRKKVLRNRPLNLPRYSFYSTSTQHWLSASDEACKGKPSSWGW